MTATVSITRNDWFFNIDSNITMKGSIFQHILRKNYETEIATSPILCLHGLGACRRVWDEISISLAEKGHTVASFDMRNHGDSSNMDDIENDLSMQSLMDDITKVLYYLQDNDGNNNEINWLKNCTIIGHSYSGNIALYYSLQQHHQNQNKVTKKMNNQIKLKRTICIDGGYINLQRTFTSGWQECLSTMVPKKDFMNEILWTQLPVILQQMFPYYSPLAINATMGSFQQLEKNNNNEKKEIIDDDAINPTPNQQQQHVMLRLDHDAHIMFLRELWDFTPHNMSKKYLDSDSEKDSTTSITTVTTTAEAITTTITIEDSEEDNDDNCIIHLLPTLDKTLFSIDKQKDISLVVNALTTTTPFPSTSTSSLHDNNELKYGKDYNEQNKTKIQVHVQWLESNHHVPLAAPAALYKILTEIVMNS